MFRKNMLHLDLFTTLNRHLNVVEGFVCLNDTESCVVGGIFLWETGHGGWARLSAIQLTLIGKMTPRAQCSNLC